jgi:L-aspartate oxidase
MRGEGAKLLNVNGRRFIEDYTPLAELAPRDVVSRAIISEMVKTGADHVYLDLRHMEAKFVKARFPQIYSTCLLYGIDITTDLIPVSPAAHYIMGGVKTDLEGKTTINGLYAAGEVACTGVHGANRLASNSLLEGLVFGARAGRAALGTSVVPEKHSCPEFSPGTIGECEATRNMLRQLMWEKAGIIRCGESLQEAKQAILSWGGIAGQTFLTRSELELKNMVLISDIIVEAALRRRGSVGAHYRTDFRERGEGWERHVAWDKENFGFPVAPIGGAKC